MCYSDSSNNFVKHVFENVPSIVIEVEKKSDLIKSVAEILLKQDIGIQVDSSALLVLKLTVIDLIRTDSDLNAFTGHSKLDDLDKITQISGNLMAKLNYNIQFFLNSYIFLFFTYIFE